MIALYLPLNQSGDCFIGATPERLVKKENDHIFSACLAGSIARGNTKEEDMLLGDSLINDTKKSNRASIRSGYDTRCDGRNMCRSDHSRSASTFET